MDDFHFDDLARSLTLPSRRDIVAAVGTAAFAALLGRAAPEAALAKKKKKKTICHNGQTIKVAKSQVKGHLAHGDTLGPCPSPSPAPSGCPLGTLECAARGDGISGCCPPAQECCTDSCCPGQCCYALVADARACIAPDPKCGRCQFPCDSICCDFDKYVACCYSGGNVYCSATLCPAE